jgi:hypothetical protein
VWELGRTDVVRFVTGVIFSVYIRFGVVKAVEDSTIPRDMTACFLVSLPFLGDVNKVHFVIKFGEVKIISFVCGTLTSVGSCVSFLERRKKEKHSLR